MTHESAVATHPAKRRELQGVIKMEGFHRQKEAGPRRLKEWFISGKFTFL